MNFLRIHRRDHKWVVRPFLSRSPNRICPDPTELARTKLDFCVELPQQLQECEKLRRLSTIKAVGLALQLYGFMAPLGLLCESACARDTQRKWEIGTFMALWLRVKSRNDRKLKNRPATNSRWTNVLCTCEECTHARTTHVHRRTLHVYVYVYTQTDIETNTFSLTVPQAFLFFSSSSGLTSVVSVNNKLE